MSAVHLLVIGDALLDRDVEVDTTRQAPDAPVPVLDERRTAIRPGGAALAAALAAADGARVTFVTALASDHAGGELAGALLDAGVDVVDLGLEGNTAEKIRFMSADGPLLRLDRGGEAGGVLGDGSPKALRAAFRQADAVLVSDYGRGLTSNRGVRSALAGAVGRVPVVWDPHPRGHAPVPGVTLATPNLAEAIHFAGRPAPVEADDELAAIAGDLAAAWQAQAIAVTRGCEGALLSAGGTITRCRSDSVGGDPCGAGDRFATGAALSLARGETCDAAVVAAVSAATDFVRAGGAHAVSLGAGDRASIRGLATGRPFARWRMSRERCFAPANVPGAPLSRSEFAGERSQESAPPAPLASALGLASRVRRRGGTVVATGGCFDLIHAGHVRVLEAAARLGDCLVVLLNSDHSVRLLKGADRPLICESERAEMLRALACVDEVAIFDEPTPAEALRVLRPDVWAKGGDYELHELPESRMVPSWGGRVAILPFVEGRSTTRLIEEVGARAQR